ncbi:heparin lyase I family protein [Marinobacterium sedimentorum]|uniref:heparin lyase I family protein n=1 Tax=Marinobacterium sedimentorum TaxID=2927804 RepID=UPI0020C60C69|nr:heparin lyase I family protein [Marinobacterium sedimentorum]MCP8690018.1 polysaccharide lyase [Marinobacterium sedimentorum]
MLHKTILAGLATAALLAFGGTTQALSGEHRFLQEGFEDGIGSGIHSLCGGCRHNRYPVVSTEQAAEGTHSLRLEYARNRTEISSVRLPLNKPLHISWALFIPDGFSPRHRGTVAQVIGWQEPCFGGGNYHLRLDNGHWGLNIRNLQVANGDRVLKKPVLRGAWTRFQIDALLSTGNDGFFTLSISDANGTSEYRLLENTKTYIECPLGPYFKAGLYGDFEDGSYLYLDDLKVTVKDDDN